MHSPGFIVICGTRWGGGGQKEVKSARGIEAFYMYFNGTGIWGGETMSMQEAIQVFLV